MAAQFSIGSLASTALDINYKPRWVSQTYITDLNGDGNGDLLVLGASYPSDGAPVAQPGFVAFGNGQGGFTIATPSQFPWATMLTVHPREVVFADFNKDGFNDVFIASHGYDAQPFPGEQNQLFLSNGDGTWRNATSTSLPPVADFSHSAAVGDVNGDGALDIVVGNTPQPNPVLPYVLVNDGHGNFTRNDSLLPTSTGQALDPSVRRILAETLADLDGDGRDDLVLGAGFSSVQQPVTSQVLWNVNGSFASSPATTLPFPAHFGARGSVYDIQAMDVNFDGAKDLVVAYQADIALGGWELQVLVNRGNHVFTDETSTYIPDASAQWGGVPTQGDPYSQYWVQFLKPIDLNGDGRMDFVLDARGSTAAPASLPVAFVHQADGTFQPVRVSDMAGNYPWVFDFSTQYAQWQGGAGFAHVYAQPSGVVSVDVLPVQFGTTTVIAPGIDGAHYAGARSAYTVSGLGNAWTVHAVNAGTPTDTLIGVERIAFGDQSLALDIAGHAGQAAKILGAVFGGASITNKEYAGIGLQLLDGGWSYESLMQLALDVRAPGASHSDIVKLLYTNVVGTPPGAGDLAYYTNLLDSGAYTPASLAVMAADTSFNAANINLVGLASTGLAYIPQG